MDFEWDENKNTENKKKHGISFEEAKQIFSGICLTWEDDRYNYGEERSFSIGAVGRHVVVAVAHIDKEDKIRIISARYATKTERKKYNENLKDITAEKPFFETPKRPRN